MFVDDCLAIYGGWEAADAEFEFLVQYLSDRGLRLNLSKTVVMSTAEYLAQGRCIVSPSGHLAQCKWESKTKYLRKTLQHFDSLDPGCLDFNDHLVHYARRVVFQALEQFSSICKRLNWCNSTQVLGVLKRYVHSKWLWIAPLIAPLQKHLEEVRRLEHDCLVSMLKLYVPGWLSKQAALAVNVLRRRTAGAFLHLANSSTVEGWISRKWRYAGHVLRMPEQSPALKAFRYGEPTKAWKQCRPGPRNMYYNWVVKLLRDLRVLDPACTFHQLRTLAADREYWASLLDRVLALYNWAPSFVKETDWVNWYSPLVHDCHWCLGIYVIPYEGKQTFIWIDRIEGTKFISREINSSQSWSANVAWISKMLAMLGTWLSYQFLVPREQAQQFDVQMYACAVRVYSEIQRIVTFQCVPDSRALRVVALL